MVPLPAGPSARIDVIKHGGVDRTASGGPGTGQRHRPANDRGSTSHPSPASSQSDAAAGAERIQARSVEPAPHSAGQRPSRTGAPSRPTADAGAADHKAASGPARTRARTARSAAPQRCAPAAAAGAEPPDLDSDTLRGDGDNVAAVRSPAWLRAEIVFAEGRDLPAAIVRVDPEDESGQAWAGRSRRAKGAQPPRPTAARLPNARAGARAGPRGGADAPCGRASGDGCGGGTGRQGAARAWAVGAAGVGCGLGRLVRRAVGGAVARVLSLRPRGRGRA
jgi:hypothetical protein